MLTNEKSGAKKQVFNIWVCSRLIRVLTNVRIGFVVCATNGPEDIELQILGLCNGMFNFFGTNSSAIFIGFKITDD